MGFDGVIAALVHPDDRDRVRPVADGAPAAGERRTSRPGCVRPDGDERHRRGLRRARAERATGSPRRCAGSIQDITEQRARRGGAGRRRAADAEAAAREHAIADELQRSLLPAAGRSTLDHLEVATYYRAGVEGTQVGGDWYDVIELGAGRTALVIGDVMGRGVQAAAVMGQLRAAVRAYARLDLPPGRRARVRSTGWSATSATTRSSPASTPSTTPPTRRCATPTPATCRRSCRPRTAQLRGSTGAGPAAGRRLRSTSRTDEVDLPPTRRRSCSTPTAWSSAAAATSTHGIDDARPGTSRTSPAPRRPACPSELVAALLPARPRRRRRDPGGPRRRRPSADEQPVAHRAASRTDATVSERPAPRSPTTSSDWDVPRRAWSHDARAGHQRAGHQRGAARPAADRPAAAHRRAPSRARGPGPRRRTCRAQRRADDDDEHGRGLQIVAAARRPLGHPPDRHGKAVWLSRQLPGDLPAEDAPGPLEDEIGA